MTQPTQPSLRRKPGGIVAHLVAGIVFALLSVTLVNVRPFSPWLPADATVRFAAEIRSPGEGTVQIGRPIFGGVSRLSSGQVQVAKSEAPRTVLVKVRAADCGTLLFQTSVVGGVMELHDPRIQDGEGRILEKFPVEQAKALTDGAIESASNGVLTLRLVPGTEVMFATEKPIGVPGDLWPGWGIALAEFCAAAILFGGLSPDAEHDRLPRQRQCPGSRRAGRGV